MAGQPVEAAHQHGVRRRPVRTLLAVAAAAGNPDVKALVHVAAYARAEGQTPGAANELGGGRSDLLAHLVFRPYPGLPADDFDACVSPDEFRRTFAQGLPRELTDVMAASQRPGALQSLITASGPPAWAAVPSWYVIAGSDDLTPPAAQRVMAERAGAATTEIDSSHVAMTSHPERVTDVITDAAAATAAPWSTGLLGRPTPSRARAAGERPTPAP